MSSLVPAGLALLGVGMFALSLWFQDAGVSVAQDLPLRPLPVVDIPAAEPAAEDEPLPVSAELVP